MFSGNAVHSTPFDGCLGAGEADGRSAFPPEWPPLSLRSPVSLRRMVPGAAAAARPGLKEARPVINHIGMSALKFSVTLQRFMTPTVGDVKK